MNMRGLIRHFAEMRKYFLAAILVFVTGIVLGYGYSEQFQAVLQSQIEGLKTVAQEINSKPNPLVWLFVFIFLNNTLKSILVVFAGIAFAVIPIGFLIMNGMVLGYLGALQVKDDSLWILVKSILPHGIIEIPAVIVASAFGIRLGMIAFKGLAGLIREPSRRLFREEIKFFLKMSVPLCILLTVSLLIAAIIETTVTPWVIGL